MNPNNKKIAIFFDSDNLSANYVDTIYKHLKTYGNIVISKAYIDWSSSHAKPWQEKLQIFGIEPIQVFSNIKGKNASDIKIAIDVCNLVNNKEIDILVLVSSDSDFTSLIIDIKSKFVKTIVFGEKKAPISLRKACDKFIELPMKTKNKSTLNQNKNNDDNFLSILKKVISKSKDKEGFALMAEVGKTLQIEYPTQYNTYFDNKRWTQIIKKTQNVFELTTQKSTTKVRIKQYK